MRQVFVYSTFVYKCSIYNEKVIPLFAIFITSNCITGQQTVNPIPMQKEFWKYTETKVEFVTHQSTLFIKILERDASIHPKDLIFERGTIEINLEIVPMV
ncbi:MAG: hypothetical protein AAGA77_00175 [Bacteroidota bacterium]